MKSLLFFLLLLVSTHPNASKSWNKKLSVEEHAKMPSTCFNSVLLLALALLALATKSGSK